MPDDVVYDTFYSINIQFPGGLILPLDPDQLPKELEEIDSEEHKARRLAELTGCRVTVEVRRLFTVTPPKRDTGWKDDPQPIP